MSKAAQTIHIEPDSVLARALKTADAAPIVLESDGVQYRVMRVQNDIWAGYDPERVRAGLRKFAGSITPEEAERIKESIYRGREEGTRPIDRP
jgi:hypothetical protein